MAKPIEDAAIGRFTWDRENEFWLGAVDLPSRDSTWLTLQIGPSERAAALALAREAVGRLRELEPEARRFLTAKLMEAQTTRAPPGGTEGIGGQWNGWT